MSTQEKLEAEIKIKIMALQSKIKKSFADLDMSNPLSVLANGEMLNKLQNEYQQIKSLNYALMSMQHGDTLQKRVSQMANEIMEHKLNNSTCQSSNVIENYRFNGKREAYIFLAKTLETVK